MPRRADIRAGMHLWPVTRDFHRYARPGMSSGRVRSSPRDRPPGRPCADGPQAADGHAAPSKPAEKKVILSKPYKYRWLAGFKLSHRLNQANTTATRWTTDSEASNRIAVDQIG